MALESYEVKIYYVECDNCKAFADRGDSTPTAEYNACSEGYTKVNNKWLCPLCNGKEFEWAKLVEGFTRTKKKIIIIV